MPAFENSEYESRVHKLQALMERSGMDALLVLSESNINYLTGYEGYSEYVPQAALVTLGSDTPYLILREMDLACATPTCWMPHDHLVPYAERYIGSADRSPWEPIAEFVKRHAKTSRLGVEVSAKSFGVKQHAQLAAGLGAEEFIDADGLVSQLKRVKSPRERAYIAEAGKIVDQAMLSGIEKIGVGIRECDVAATIMANLCAGTETIPGNAPWPPTMPVAPRANAPHLKWSDGVYEAGHQTNFEIGAFRHRYCCALSRTAYLGTAPERLRYIHSAVQDGFHAAVDALRPGKSCGDVAHAFEAAFSPYGVRKESRIGYSIGIDWADGGASLQPDDDSEIVAGMMLHVIVGIWEREEGYVFSETTEVTDQGPRSMSSVPRSLFEVDP